MGETIAVRESVKPANVNPAIDVNRKRKSADPIRAAAQLRAASKAQADRADREDPADREARWDKSASS